MSMKLTHNQLALAAIMSTLIVASLFVGANGFWQNSEIGSFESAQEDDIFGEGSEAVDSTDTDNDGLSDILESSQYGTDPNDPDTDGDSLLDGWEVANGLNPLDNGDSEEVEEVTETIDDSDDVEVSEEDDSWPDPNQGPNGDPDNDGLTNQDESALGTDPQRADTDNDGLNDKWESLYSLDVQTPAGIVTLFDPLSGNWDCALLDQAKKDQLSVIFDGTDGNPTWDSMARNGMHSCDMVLDSDNDGLANFIEEGYGTNPTSTDSDNDRIDDIVEVSNSSVNMFVGVGEDCGIPLLQSINRDAPFMMMDRTWFTQDMDGDGFKNGPSDYDTDGDGMPDGFEYCYSHQADHPSNSMFELLNPSNASDGYGDWDEDGMNNLRRIRSFK